MNSSLSLSSPSSSLSSRWNELVHWMVRLVRRNRLLSLMLSLLLLFHLKSIPFVWHIRFGWNTFKYLTLQRKQSPNKLMEGSEIEGRLMPDDLDFNFHMNNASYNKQGDFGRLKLFLESGIQRLCWKNGWWYGNGGVYFSFKREIKPFQSWTLVSKLHSYDSKWIFFEHTFKVKGQAAAIGFSKFVFKQRDRKNVSPRLIIEELSKLPGGEKLKDILEKPSNSSGEGFGSDLARLEVSLENAQL
eukprot:TRINITY_DN877_c0_g1_i1.p1 TRINITY_DN877_c0_g1~~TRINITY_DN877_c0_g1_i1.p1  ORF type:complete len:244 (-),score=74.18 TRINITY_DN877_c0_g1_i1:51-782(-)